MKERLQWGEPGLTIIDARDRESFLEERITGAMLVSDMNNLEKNREIYVYSNTDEEAAEAADKLRQAGYENRIPTSGWYSWVESRSRPYRGQIFIAVVAMAE